jgi:hypothetical protein
LKVGGVEMNYPFDYSRFYFFVIMIAVFAIYSFIKRKDFGKDIGIPPILALFTLLIGTLFLLISTLGACIKEGCWKFDFIIAFLSFHNVTEQANGFYYLRSVSYTILMLGIAQIAFGFKKRL